LGLDIDQAKVDAINAGRSYIKHIDAAAISGLVKTGRFSASTDFGNVKKMGSVAEFVGDFRDIPGFPEASS
jgi:UDP-N-acetyl-D-glucosamine dehydrogenase